MLFAVLLACVLLSSLGAEQESSRASEAHSRMKNILSKASKKIDKAPKSMNRQIVDFKKDMQKKQKESHKVGRRKTFSEQKLAYYKKKKLRGKIEFD
jgi:hypothetical protein